MKVCFSVDCPKMDKRKTKRGEDAPPVSKDGIMIICDGTGATGMSEHEISSGRYPEGKYTSAYLGSRETSRLAEEYLRENYDNIMSVFSKPDSEALKAIVQNLGNTIQNGLDAFRRENHLELTVRGKSFKLLPTTFTAVVYRVCDNCVEAVVLSAGDSHALWWDEKGICRLSSDGSGMEDDIAEGDCKINNCIATDSDFCINYLCHRLPPKGILVVTSDGFTDPITFFEQEWFLIKWIRDFYGKTTEPSVRELSDAISRQIDQTGFSNKDDCSLSGAIVGYENSGELITTIKNRLDVLGQNYLQRFQKLKEKQRQREQTIDETQKNRIDAIQKEIVEVIKEPGRNNDKLQVLLSTDTVRQKEKDLDSKVQKETKELQQRLNEQTNQVFSKYKAFLRTLCPLPVKPFKPKRFSDDIIRAVKQCDCDETEIESLLLHCNKFLNEIKSLPEIRKEAGDVTSLKNKVDDFSSQLKKLHDRFLTHEENKTKIEKFFEDKEKMTKYFLEDREKNFQILSNYPEEELCSHSLYEAKNEILELQRQIDELKKQCNEWENSKKENKRLDLIKSSYHAIAMELLRKGQDAEFVSPQNAPHNYTCVKDLQDQLDDIITELNKLKRTYAEQYKSRIVSVKVRTIEVKRKEA